MKAANPVWPHAGVGTRICATWGWYGSGNGSQPSSCSTPHLSLQVQQLTASSCARGGSVWTLGKKIPLPKEWLDAGTGAAGVEKKQLAEGRISSSTPCKTPLQSDGLFPFITAQKSGSVSPPKARTRAAAPHPQQIFIALLTAQSWRSSEVCSCSAVGRLPLLF